MHETYFADVTLPGANFQVAQGAYLDWAAGQGRFAEILGSQRQQDGWPAGRRLDAMALSDDVVGRFDLQASFRQASGRFLLWLHHRDKTEPGVLWHTMAQASETQDGIRIRHAVGQTYPAGSRPSRLAGVPRALKALFEDAREEGPRDTQVVLTTPQDVVSWMETLASDTSTIPKLLLTADPIVGWLLDPGEAAVALRGMAEVAAIVPDPKTTWQVREFLEANGYNPKLTVFRDAVRVFYPPLRQEDAPSAHPLWTANMLNRSGWARSDALGIIARDLAVRATPPGTWRALHDWDSAIRNADHQRLEKRLQEGAQKGASTEEELTQLRDVTRSLRNQLAEETDDKQKLGEDLTAAAEEIKRLRNEYHQLATEFSTEGEGALAELAEALVTDKEVAISTTLRLLEKAFPERIVVLPEALRSAKKHSAFQDIARARNLLWSLVTKGWDALNSGGDYQMKTQVFANKEFAPQDSSPRVHYYQGRDLDMRRHLKITHGGKRDTWRCHFAWVDRKIYVWHCGEHLPG